MRSLNTKKPQYVVVWLLIALFVIYVTRDSAVILGNTHDASHPHDIHSAAERAKSKPLLASSISVQPHDDHRHVEDNFHSAPISVKSKQEKHSSSKEQSVSQDHSAKENSPLLTSHSMCQKWNDAAREHKKKFGDFATATVNEEADYVEARMMRYEACGYGSLLKGVVTMYIFAILHNKPFRIVTDSPPLEAYWRSPYIVPNVSATLKKLPLQCGDWMKPANENTPLHELVEKWKLKLACDRNHIHRMQLDSVYGPMLQQLGLGKPVYPGDVYGCAFATLFEAQPAFAATVHSLKRGKSYIGIQLRRGGSGVPWKDPKRIDKKEVGKVTECIQGYITKYLKKHPSHYVFLTADSPKWFSAVKAFIPAERFLSYKPDIFFHTALSRVGADKLASLDEKIAVDHAMLFMSNHLFVTRSAFGETASWLSFARNRTKLVQQVCLNVELDCATTNC